MGKENELLEAARVGNVNVIERLLANKQRNVLSQALSFRRSVSANCQDGSGYTPLHHAVLNGHCEAVQHLLKHDASPIVPDNRGNTPLHLAAWTGNGGILKALLVPGISGSQVNEQNNDLDSHLHFASQYGHTEVVEVLLENGANPDVLNKKEESPLDLASQYGRLEVVDVLLKRDPSLLNKIPKNRSLLHLAARNGHHLIVRKLLDYGYDINKMLKNGTALHEAALFGKVEVVRTLLESEPQIDVYAKDNLGETALEKVHGHTSKIARDIAKLIRAFARGEPLPQTSSPVVSVLSQSSSDGDDAEPPSVYDNLPSKSNSTLPLMQRKTRENNRSYEPVQLKNSGKRDPPSNRENYVNIKFGEKGRTPPKKPARVSIGHLLEQLNENGLTENSNQGDPSSSFTNSASMYELREITPPSASLQHTAVSQSHLAVPSSPSHNVWCSSKDPLVVPEEDDFDVGDYASLRTDAHVKGAQQETATDVRSSLDSESTGADPDSLYEELAQTSSKQDKRPHGKSKRKKVSAPIASMDSDPEGDIEVYELLSEAVSGDKKERPHRSSSSSSSVPSKSSKPSVVLKPVPAPRRNVSPSITPLSPKYCEAVTSNGSTPSEDLPQFTKHEEHPEIPSHPPPSPHTAMLGVQARFSQHKCPDSSVGDDNQWCSCDELPGECTSISSFSPDNLPPPLHHFTFQSIAEESGVISSSSEPSVNTRLKMEDTPLYASVNGRVSNSQTSSKTQSKTAISSAGSKFKPVPTQRTNIPIKFGNLNSEENENNSARDNGKIDSSSAMSTASESNVALLTVEQVEKFNAIPSSPTKRVLRMKSEDAGTDSSSESDVLRPDDTDPFAGLLKGSNQRARGITMQERPLKIDEKNMGTDSKDGNGKSEDHGTLDETSEWAQIESIMASFGAGLVRESVYMRDYEMNFQKMFEDDVAWQQFVVAVYGFTNTRGSDKPQTVADWLDRLGIGQYLYTLIANGFDNLNFLGGGIMEDQDLQEIGIQDEGHRKLLLEAAKCLPKMKSIGDGGDHVAVPSSITEWLRSLVLSDYIQNFTEKGKTTMEKVRGLWEVELENVLEVHMLGHRKRILASLGDWRRSIHSLQSSGSAQALSDITSNTSPALTSRSALDLTLDLESPHLAAIDNSGRGHSSSLDIDLFKDYSKDVTSPLRSKPAPGRGANGKAWTLPERSRRHQSDRSMPLSKQTRNHAHSQESLPEEIYTSHERGSSNALSIPRSGKKTQEMGTQVTPGIDENIPDIIKTDLNEKRGLARQNSAHISTQTTDDLSDNSSLDVIANTKQQSPTWMHRPEDLVKGCCNYTASYLGSTIVKDLQGTESTREACVKLRRSASHVQKVPSITLSISYAGVKFIDTKSKIVITEHEICNISCVAQDEEDMKTFAYITRDEAYDRLYCHVFTVKTLDLATEIILTLGQAFEIAYQLLVKTHPPPVSPLSSPDAEDTKL